MAASARSLRLWGPIRKVGADVRPVVVLWGGGLGSWPEEERVRLVDGVPVVAGPGLSSWLASQEAVVLDGPAIDGIWSALDEQAGIRETGDRAANPVPTSLARHLLRAGCAIVGAYGAVVTIPVVLRRTSPGWGLAACVALVVIGAALLRAPLLRRIRPLLWGWVAGTGGATAALIVLYVRAAVA